MSRLPISILMALTFWSAAAFSDPATENTAVTDSSAVPTTPPVVPQDAATKDVPPDTTFSQGLETFKASDLAESRNRFSSLLTQHPNDPVLLYNLGLVEMTDKHPGRALACWRKALYLQPGFSPALSGIRQVHRLIPSLPPSSLWDEIYWRVPLWFFLSASFIFFVLSGVLWILHTVRIKLDKPSSVTAPLFTTFLLLIFLSVALHSYFTYYSISMATVIDPTPVRSSPAEGAPSLIEFNEGDEVTVIRTQDPWLQVQKSATAVGWVHKDKLFIHSGF